MMRPCERVCVSWRRSAAGSVLGASSLTYAEATWGQTTCDWITAQAHALEAFGGVPAICVVDNAKALITKPLAYEPAVQRTFATFAEHYGLAVLNARVHRPKDKAKVEVAVQIVQRWVLARLRNVRFTSLAQVNEAIAALVALLNARKMRKLGASRLELFERVEKAALRPLPAEPYVYTEWKICRVGRDYHVEVGGHYYSVHHRHLGEEVDVRLTARTVEIFLRGERIAAHMREAGVGRHTTSDDHMPEAHRAYAGWTLENARRQARDIGPAPDLLVRLIIESKRHPIQGLRACTGILRLVRPTAPSGWRTPARGRSRSGPAATPRSGRSSTTGSIAACRAARTPAT
jgi:transposase